MLAMIAAAALSFDLARAQETGLGDAKVTGARTPSAVIPTLQDEIVRTERFTHRDIEQTAVPPWHERCSTSEVGSRSNCPYQAMR
jgi:hypothetical protein